MEYLLLFARLTLAAVFAVAGVAKLMDLPGSRRAMENFGAPLSLAGALAVTLPVAELIAAALLLSVAAAKIGASLALVLLVVFLVAIGYQVARGRRPDCHCFGQLHSAPAGPATLARNAALAVLAGGVVWRGGGVSAVAWIGDGGAVGVALAAFMAVTASVLGALTFLLLQTLKQNGRLLVRVEAVEARLKAAEAATRDIRSIPVSPTAPWRDTAHDGDEEPEPPKLGRIVGLEEGTTAPAFRLPDLEGTPRSLHDLLRGGNGRGEALPLLLLFTDPHCVTCTQLLPEVALWQQMPEFRMVLISRGKAEANRRKADRFGLTLPIVLQTDHEVADAYEVAGTPTGVLINADGSIRSRLAEAGDALRALVADREENAEAREKAIVTP